MLISRVGLGLWAWDVCREGGCDPGGWRIPTNVLYCTNILMSSGGHDLNLY